MLFGHQLRTHRDVDLLVDSAQLPRARTVLSDLGYRAWHEDPSAEVIGELEISSAEALRDGAMRVIELHGCQLDALELTVGSLDGLPVKCMRPEQQLRDQRIAQGVAWSPWKRRRQRRNVEALEFAVARRD